MRIALLNDPWAADAAHIVEVADASDLRSAMASIPPARYALAIWLPDDGKPHIAQASRGDFPDCVSIDGFGYVVTGPRSLAYHQQVWDMLETIPAMIAAYDRFLGVEVPSLIRPAIYGTPRLVRDDE